MTARTPFGLLVQHPGVVAADDGLDLARGEMPGSEHGHALLKRQPRDVGDLPEAVTVLVQEGLAVDLQSLAAIGGCGGHTASMEKGRVPALSAASGSLEGRPGHGCGRRRTVVAWQAWVVRHDIEVGTAVVRGSHVRRERKDHEGQHDHANE